MFGVLLTVLVAAAPENPREDRTVSREETIQVGVTRNLDLLSKRFELRRVELLGRGSWRPYSPTVSLDGALRQSGASPTAPDRYFDYAVGAGWRSIIGTTVGARMAVSQQLPGTLGAGGSRLDLGVSQPLLKDGWLAGAALPIREAELNAAVQKEIYLGELNALVLNLVTGYWDLAVAEADVKIKQRSRERAQQQYDDTKENIRRGIIADVEIYVVEENVVLFEQDLIRTAQTLKLSQRRLAELLVFHPESALVPKDQLDAPVLQLPAKNDAVAAGLELNPGLRAQRGRVELAQARYAFARNQQLPSLNLNASLGLLTAPVPDATVGLSFGIPLDRWAINAATDSARADLERQEAELRNQENRVRFELENAFTELETNVKLMELAKKRVTITDLKLQAQVEKYKSGLSTLADVVRFQRDWDDARINAQRAIRQVYVNEARVQATLGVLPQSAGLKLE